MPSAALSEEDVRRIVRDELDHAERAKAEFLAEWQKCPACRGSGLIDGFWLGTVKRCPACKGKGRV